MSIREEKRKALKDKLINAATQLIQENGVSGLNARNVTKNAGCALGSLYSVFKDLDNLILNVNSNTLDQLDVYLKSNTQEITDPVDKLKALAQAYAYFAKTNFPLWYALFDYSWLSTEAMPDWYTEHQIFLVQHIAEPVSQLSPHLSKKEIMTRTRTLFTAVHGIVSFSMEDRYVGVPQECLEDELNRFIDQLVAGLEK